MRWFGYITTILAVMGLAVWAYDQNHQTQGSMAERREIHRDIRALNEALEVQKAEWAFLNRPDRLRKLVELNFDSLGLDRMTGAHFGRIDEVPYPLPVALITPPADLGPNGAGGMQATSRSEDRP